MNQKNGSRHSSDPLTKKAAEQKKQQHGVRDVQSDIDHVIPVRLKSAAEVVQIKSEKCKLPQMKRIEEVRPPCRVRHVTVIGNERVVEMEGVVERRPEKQDTRENQAGRHFHAIVAAPII